MDNAIRFIDTPSPLRDPVLLVAVRGAGSNSAGAVAALFERYEPQPIADVDPDEFYDFTAVRPFAQVLDGERTISWPQIRFVKVPLAERDLVVVSPIEPSVRWRRFAAIAEEVSRAFGIRDVVLLSAFGGATPHTRPIPVQWMSVSPDLGAHFGMTPRRPRYQGPATFSMALGVMLRDAGLSVGTLNAIVPFYLGIDPSPHAVRAQARALEREYGLSFDLEEVDRHLGEVERQAAAQLEGSDHLRMFLSNLEQQYDEARGVIDDERHPEETHDEAPPLPEADRVLADVEAILRRSGAGDGTA
jgi:hypothetical protein